MRFLFCFLALTFSAFALDLGSRVSQTPYDSYFATVREVLFNSTGDGVTLRELRPIMAQGLAFHYAHITPYAAATPAATEVSRSGDCKDKALWLLSKCHDTRARFVIGRLHRASIVLHAWVLLKSDGAWRIADCTLTGEPRDARRFGRNDYVALYSYGRSGSFAHRGLGASSLR